MSADIHYEPMIAETDIPAVSRLLVHAFAGTPEGVKDWIASAGHEHFRVVRLDDGTPGACLLRIPMGQYFGGRSVPMIGIAGVGTAPETRGQGLARQMMRREMQDEAREGVPLSVLYPSTQALYRQAGYEQAGQRLNARIPLAAIDVRDRDLRVEHLGDADMDAVKAAYGRFATQFDGMVDRGPYVWNRVRKFREDVYHGFGVRDASGGLDGYLFMLQKRKNEPGARQNISLTDFVFHSPQAGRRLLGFLADFGTLGDDVEFATGPSHPALMLLSQQRYKLEFHFYWMLRILSVEKALTARGYAPGIDAEVHFQVEDDLLPDNNGRFTLRVEGGRAEVSRGGRGDLRTSIRGLAAIYTGHMSPAALAICGMASGTGESMRTAGAVFGGAAPWMTDFF